MPGPAPMASPIRPPHPQKDIDMQYVPIKPAVPPQVPLVDNSLSGETFVTGIAGCANFHGVFVATLESARCDHSQSPPAVERIVVARLAMTGPAAQSLVAALNDFLTQQGLSPSRAMVGDATRQ